MRPSQPLVATSALVTGALALSVAGCGVGGGPTAYLDDARYSPDTLGASDATWPDDDASDPAVDSSVDAQGDGSPSTTIGPAGGTVTFEGVVITIPPGALASARSIRVTTSQLALPSGYLAVGPVYAFEPEGLTFAAPIDVAFPLPTSGETGMPLWSSATGAGFDMLDATLVGGKIHAHPTHFSYGFIGAFGCEIGNFDGTLYAPGLTLHYLAGSVDPPQSIMLKGLTGTPDTPFTLWLFGGLQPQIAWNQDRLSVYFELLPHDLRLLKPVTVDMLTWVGGLPPEPNYVEWSGDARSWTPIKPTTVTDPGFPNYGLTAQITAFGYLTGIHECGLAGPSGGVGYVCSFGSKCPPEYPVSHPPTFDPPELVDVWCHGDTYTVGHYVNASVGPWVTTFDWTCRDSSDALIGTCTTTLRRIGCDTCGSGWTSDTTFTETGKCGRALCSW
jgi:hypothetical protein